MSGKNFATLLIWNGRNGILSFLTDRIAYEERISLNLLENQSSSCAVITIYYRLLLLFKSMLWNTIPMLKTNTYSILNLHFCSSVLAVW